MSGSLLILTRLVSSCDLFSFFNVHFTVVRFQCLQFECPPTAPSSETTWQEIDAFLEQQRQRRLDGFVDLSRVYELVSFLIFQAWRLQPSPL